MRNADNPVDYSKVHTLLEECANKVFNETLKNGEYFESLEFTVTIGSDHGGFENIIIHKTKKGFFESKDE